MNRQRRREEAYFLSRTPEQLAEEEAVSIVDPISTSWYEIEKSQMPKLAQDPATLRQKLRHLSGPARREIAEEIRKITEILDLFDQVIGSLSS